MDKSIDKKIKQYVDLVRKYMPVDMIILYGSHARGTARSGSDIDIAVVVDEIQGDFLDISAHLFTLCRDIDVDIEPKLITRKNNRSGFLDTIMTYGKVIYQNDHLPIKQAV